MLEWQIWDVIDPAEEFLRRIRGRWKHAGSSGEQNAKKEEWSLLNSRLEIGHLRFNEYQHWGWLWRSQAGTPAPKDSIRNASANRTFSDLMFDELKSATTEAQGRILVLSE